MLKILQTYSYMHEEHIVAARRKEGRGKLLSALMAYEGLNILIHATPGLLYVGYAVSSNPLYGVVIRQGLDVQAILFIVIETIALIGVWKWQRWAAYTLLVVLSGENVHLLITNSRLQDAELRVGVATVLLLWLLVWVTALARKWKLFS